MHLLVMHLIYNVTESVTGPRTNVRSMNVLNCTQPCLTRRLPLGVRPVARLFVEPRCHSCSPPRCSFVSVQPSVRIDPTLRRLQNFLTATRIVGVFSAVCDRVSEWCRRSLRQVWATPLLFLPIIPRSTLETRL